MPSPLPRLGLAVAGSLAAYVVAIALPAVAIPLLVLAPLPGLIIGVRASTVEGVAWSVLAGVVIAVVLGGAAMLAFLLTIAAPTLALVLAVRAAWPFDRVVLTGLAVWCAGLAGVLVIAYGDLSNLLVAAREQLMASFDLALTTSQSMGAPDATIAAMEADRADLVSGVVEMLPALAVLSGGVFVIVNMLLMRNATGVFGDINLRLWRAPDQLIWVLIGAGFGMFIPVPLAALVARNVLVIVLACYFCQGLAIVSYYLVRFRLPRALRIASYALIAIHQVFAATVLALGIFDFWANFRRPSTGPADFGFHE